MYPDIIFLVLGSIYDVILLLNDGTSHTISVFSMGYSLYTPTYGARSHANYIASKVSVISVLGTKPYLFRLNISLSISAKAIISTLG
jgi:hypothetical protein